MTRARLRRAPRAPLRAVLDTNVLVSYLLTHRPPIATLIDVHLAQEEVVLITAPELLEQLDRVLQYPKLQRYYSDEERTRFVALLMALSELVELPDPIPLPMVSLSSHSVCDTIVFRTKWLRLPSSASSGTADASVMLDAGVGDRPP